MSRNQVQDKASLIKQLKKMPIVQVACERTGMSRSTYYRWKKEDEEFALECDTAISESTGLINDMAESQLIRAIKDCNLTAIIFWLKNHHKAYGNKMEVKGQIKLAQQELTPEQKEAVAKALQLSGFISKEELQDEKEEKK